MNWFKKIFRKKEKVVKQSTQRPAQSYKEYLEHMRRLDDQEFYDLYFNHPPIESYLPESDNSGISESLTTPDNGIYDPFGHGGTFGGGGASSSWDDHNSSNSSYDSGYDSGSYDSGSSDNSSND